MIKHTIIWDNGFHVSFDHAKKIDWDIVRDIINCRVIEISQARWDGNNYEMLCDENALLKEKSRENIKATKAYHDYWIQEENKNPGTIDLDNLKSRTIFGHVLLVKKNK